VYAATVNVNSSHPITQGMTDFQLSDEWYYYGQRPDTIPGAHVLLAVDENTLPADYPLAQKQGYHPIAVDQRSPGRPDVLLRVRPRSRNIHRPDRGRDHRERRRMGRASALIACLIAGCGSPGHLAVDGGPGDAGVDPATDADLRNYDVAGVYLDWDSTAASPCPIAGATWTVYFGGGRTGTTDASGAFTVRLASYLARIDVEQPHLPSACATTAEHVRAPGERDHSRVIHDAGGHPVIRSLTSARATAFYAAIGAPFQATRGQLLVHLDGPARSVALSAPHDAVQAFDGQVWAAGDTGSDVFFPNVDVTNGVWPTVTVAGHPIGAGSLELPPGTITSITVITR